jgi:hypothetical protein
MIVCRDGEHVFALSSGQHGRWARHGEAKYAKLAYSTDFGFSVPVGQSLLERGAYDSALALSDDGIHYRTREETIAAELRDGALWALWQPWPDVEIETWLTPALPWHIRVHRIRTGRHLHTAEGGWALNRSEAGATPGGIERREGPGAAVAVYPAGWSGIRDLRGARTGVVIEPSPNSNLLHPQTVLPTLLGELEPGEHWLVCAVIGRPPQLDWEAIWKAPPDAPVVPA